MGNIEVTQCRFSGLPAETIWNDRDVIEYAVKISNRRYEFVVSRSYWSNTEPRYINNYIITGLLLNRKWPDVVRFKSEEDIIKILSEADFPKTPQEKLDNLFEFLFNTQTKDGGSISLHKFWSSAVPIQSLFFIDHEECAFYLKVLLSQGLINGKIEQSMTTGLELMYYVNISFEGFGYYNKITNEGLKSKNCFIAMSFGREMGEIRRSIKAACIKTNFVPILIDEVHADSDKTINDEIIANIKKSKFCIADFTEQRDGVYFESGYALGRGLKVIYTCREDDFKQSHFDTNHFPHIIYSTGQDLEEKLVNKIEAWIKD